MWRFICNCFWTDRERSNTKVAPYINPESQTTSIKKVVLTTDISNIFAISNLGLILFHANHGLFWEEAMSLVQCTSFPSNIYMHAARRNIR